MSWWIFLLGALLLVAGAIGGGFEIRELKIPKIGAASRIIATSVGAVLIVLGVGMDAVEKLPNPDPDPFPSNAADVKEAIPANQNTQNTRHAAGMLTDEQRSTITEFVFQADKAEIDAFRSGDAGFLDAYYAGDALARLQRDIDDTNQQGLAIIMSIDTARSHVVNVRLVGDSIFSVDMCEYWQSELYDRGSGALLRSEPLELTPQTINIQEVNGQPFITSIAFHTGTAFCDRR